MTQREEFKAWVAENPDAPEAYDKWSTGQPFRTDLATWHAFRAGAEWKVSTQPLLGFQTRRANKAEDELWAAKNEIENLNQLLNAAYVDPAAQAAQPADYDTWAKHPYTLVLQKSIEQDYVPRTQPAHAHAIDTSPECVEKQAGNVQVPEGWQLVPVEPTEAMWSELARDIVFWLYATRSPHYGSKLHSHLQNLGREIPDWLTKEVPDVDHTPPKGTVAVCIYKAMLAAAPSTKEQSNAAHD